MPRPSGSRLISVSYTHLDVYKRQIVGRALALTAGELDGAAHCINKGLGDRHAQPCAAVGDVYKRQPLGGKP